LHSKCIISTQTKFVPQHPSEIGTLLSRVIKVILGECNIRYSFFWLHSEVSCKFTLSNYIWGGIQRTEFGWTAKLRNWSSSAYLLFRSCMFSNYQTSSSEFWSVAILRKEIMSEHPSSCASTLLPNKFKYALLVTISSVQENGCITPAPVDAPLEYVFHEMCIWWVQQDPYVQTCIHTHTYICSTYTHNTYIHEYTHTHIHACIHIYMVHLYICSTCIHT